MDSDLDRAGQDTRSLRSKILRLDVDHPAGGKPYSVPTDNPFVGDKRFAPETWAYGLRNPWRLTFDAASGQLWAAENGQDLWEYARLVQRGANYGWSAFEGSHPFAQDRALGPHPVTFPTLEFSHAEFRSLSGGVVYRGKQFPELAGAYVFGDFGTGRVWAAKHDGAEAGMVARAARYAAARSRRSPPMADGELLITDYGSAVLCGGREWRHLPASSGRRSRPIRRPPFPQKLSETGLFSDVERTRAGAGRAAVTRSMRPAGTMARPRCITSRFQPSGTLEVRPVKSWHAPDETVLAQTLMRDGRRLETRVLVKQQNDWAGYSYVWNAAQTDAELAGEGGAEIEVAGASPWHVPSRAECMMCHSRQANFALTLHEAQLNRGDQLSRWERLGLLRADALGFERDRACRGKAAAAGRERAEPAELRRLRRCCRAIRSTSAVSSAEDDAQASLEDRARSYLGVNCAHCHTMSGGGNSAMDFDWLLPRDEMHAIDERPHHGDFGIPDARVIAPGAAARSVVIPPREHAAARARCRRSARAWQILPACGCSWSGSSR